MTHSSTGAVVAYYPEVYIDFYRAFLECGGIRQRTDLVVDTVRDQQLVSFFRGLADDIRKDITIPGGYVDSRLCLDLLDSHGSVEAQLSVGWIALWDSTYTPKNVDPRKNIWHPFCQLDGVGVIELDSLEGALVLETLPPGYLGTGGPPFMVGNKVIVYVPEHR
jgi:hypothetical protein